MVGDDALDLLDGRCVGAGLRIHLVEDVPRELEIDRPAGQRVGGDDADQRALEGADVVGDAIGDQLEHASSSRRMRSNATRLRRIATRVMRSGGVDVGDEPGLEALAQALLDGHELAGQTVAGDDELAAGLVERVEGVEELLLGLRLAGEELDVVDQQHVGVAVGALEAAAASAS